MRGLYLFVMCYKAQRNEGLVFICQGSVQNSAMAGLDLFFMCYKVQHKLAQ